MPADDPPFNARTAVVHGGMLDGQTVTVQGIHLVHPFVDNEHAAAYREWFEVYGVAYAFWQTDPEYPEWTHPRPPRIPVEVYRWEFVNRDDLIARFDRVERYDRD